MNASSATADYAGVVDQLTSASRGGYRGPGVSVDRISQALSTTAGLNPSSILHHTQAAVGSSSSDGMRGGIIVQIAKFIGQAALGEILGRIGDAVLDWTNNRDESTELERSAEDVGDALNDIEEVSDTAITEILFALRAVISQLCVFLSQVDPSQHPREFGECVATGAELIDSAGSAILGTCGDRDEAVSGCLDEFLSRGDSVCGQPDTRTQACAVTCEDSAQPPVAAPTTAADSPTTPQSVAPPAPQKEMEPVPSASTPEDCPPKTPELKASCDPEEPTTPQTAAPPPPPKDLVHPEQEQSECKNEEEIRSGCTGVLGAAGVGVLLVGIGLVVEVLVDHTSELMPEPMPAPEPEPEPEPEPAPEPPPPPKQVADEEPPPDLSQVEEPPPPPKKFIPATNPAPEPLDPPVQPDNSASLEQSEHPAPASVPGGARKAGEW